MNVIMQSVIVLSVSMQNVILLYAECRYAECHAECHYGEHHFAEWHNAECHYNDCKYAEYHKLNIIPWLGGHYLEKKVLLIEMKGVTRSKLTIISESAVCKTFLGQIISYPDSLQISNSRSLECYVVI